MNAQIIKLIACNDQDLAAGVQWWREATPEAKAALVAVVCATYEHPLAEVMSRMALIGLARVVIACQQPESTEEDHG